MAIQVHHLIYTTYNIQHITSPAILQHFIALFPHHCYIPQHSIIGAQWGLQLGVRFELLRCCAWLLKHPEAVPLAVGLHHRPPGARLLQRMPRTRSAALPRPAVTLHLVPRRVERANKELRSHHAPPPRSAFGARVHAAGGQDRPAEGTTSRLGVRRLAPGRA